MQTTTETETRHCEQCGEAETDYETLGRCAFWADGFCMTLLCGSCFEDSPCANRHHELPEVWA